MVLYIAAAAWLAGCDESNGPDDDGGHLNDIPVIWDCDEEGRRPGPGELACSGDDKRYVKGDCRELRCDAGQMAPNCCPGQICTAGGSCVVPPSRYETCETDDDCDRGLFCLDRPMVTTEGKTCGYLPVDAAGGCPLGGQPFNDRCVVGAPCGAACQEGTVCNIDAKDKNEVYGGICEKIPSLDNGTHGCDQSCNAAELLVYADPDTMLFDACCEVRCECLTLPPLEPGNWGRFSDALLGDEGLLISAYDVTYGDLVLATANPNTANIETLDYIDGVPSGGAIVADPEGPRGGRGGLGTDVGQYTSLALTADGSPRIAYWDVEAKALKLAAWNDVDARWEVSFVDHGSPNPGDVDDPDLDVGRYPSLVIDRDDILHISYFAANARPAVDTITAPMYARSTTVMPAGPDDWIRVPVEEVRSCNGQCTPTQACVDNTGVVGCINLPVDPSACDPVCDCDETCVDIAGGQCRTTLPNRLDIPCDALCTADEACADDTEGGTDCYALLATGCTGCADYEVCVEHDTTGEPVCRIHTPFSRIGGLPDGVGLFTSMVLHNDTPTLVYHDRIRRGLRGAVALFTYDQSPSAGFNSGALVCDTSEDFGQHASLAVAPDGTLAVAFQGGGGETLNLFRTSAGYLFTGTVEAVDDGIRDSRLHLVGAGADLSFDPEGVPWIAYADQTDNDLLLAFKPTGGGEWICKVVLADGAYGSSARFVLAGDTAYITTYLRSRDELGRDASRLVIKRIGLDSASLDLLDSCWPEL